MPDAAGTHPGGQRDDHGIAVTGPWENLPPREPPPQQVRAASRLGLWLWLGAMAALVVLLFALDRWFPGARTSADGPQIVQLLVFVALLSSGLLFVRQTNWRRTFRYIALWLAVGAVLVLGYAFQEPLTHAALQLRSQLLPGEAVATGAREITLSEGDDGHYAVYGAVNGERVRFLVDTGATDIVLSPADARRAGIHPDSLKYDKPYATANGVGYGATVTLDRLEVGAITLSDVRVSVQQAEMGTSLLGMTFLRRLKSYSVSERKLVLRW
jgi:aspartyl protease family protein